MTDRSIPSMTDPNYDATRLLNEVMARTKSKNDAALAAVLGVTPPVISKIRHNTLAVGASMIIRIADKADMTLKEILGLLVAAPAPAAAQ